MICPTCGGVVIGNEPECPFCHKQCETWQSPLPPVQGQAQEPLRRLPFEYGQFQSVNTHLVGAILSTFFCCMPVGIVAIVYAAMAEGRLRAGDYAGAVAQGEKARTWMVVSVVAGLFWMAIWLILELYLASR